MIRDYEIVSPSLDGILRHDSIVYDGIKRPMAVAAVLDRSSVYHSFDITEKGNRQVFEEYYHDLYGVLLKKLSHFAVDSEPPEGEAVKLQAMLQELIKVKKILRSR